MRVYREKMPRSKCVHCVEAWFPGERDENKGRIGLCANSKSGTRR